MPGDYVPVSSGALATEPDARACRDSLLEDNPLRHFRRVRTRWAGLASLALVAVLLAVSSAFSLAPRQLLASLQPEGKFSLLPSPHINVLELVLKAYQKLSGASDPFQFQCPLPLAVRGLVLLPAEPSREDCCMAYDKLSWPYQFQECIGIANCSSCYKASADTDLLRHSSTAELAGAAWAAVVTTKGHAHSKWGWSEMRKQMAKLMTHGTGDERVDGHRMLASLGSGLHMHEVDVCPQIDDWSVSMLNEEDNNIHARVFRSKAAKLAIVAFRGTQATSMKNWQVDTDIETTPLDLGNGRTAQVHEGFLSALQDVAPQVRRWVEGYVFHYGAVPEGWQLVFTGHSLGGALAILAATQAELEGWSRKPDAVITWGTPRVGDSSLNDWWESRGLCSKLLRVNAFNDIIHWFPFKKMWSWWSVFTDVGGCAEQDSECRRNVAFSDSSRWMHVCNRSEFIVPAAMRGLNERLEDFSPVGAILSHFVSNCLFGYGYGVLHSGIAKHDVRCGIGKDMCPGLA